MLCESLLDTPEEYIARSGKLVTQLGVSGVMPQFKEEWDLSGITAGNRQLETSSLEETLSSMGEVQRQFDQLPWLVKALTAKDIQNAKRDGRKAGIVTAQDTVGLGKNLALLESLHGFDLRALQLTYNTQNHVGAGCAERSNAGLTNFGVKFVGRMNDLGIMVGSLRETDDP